MYQSLAIKLKNTTRVKRIMQNMDIKNKNLTPIVLTNKIYESYVVHEIECYFYKRYSELNIINDNSTAKIRREYLSEKVILPLGLKLEDVADFLNNTKPFKKLKCDSFIIAGVAMERFIIDESNKFNILNNIPKQDRNVYAFKLKDSIKEDNKYKEHNPNWNIDKPAFYVGQTAKSRQERYYQHVSGEKSNRFMRKYALVPFEKADKSKELSKKFAIPIDKLRYYQALYYEQKLTLVLKENGFGAYSN
jgi:hypothetical protein